MVVCLSVNDEGEAVRVAARAVLPHTDLRVQVGVGVKVDLKEEEKNPILDTRFHNCPLVCPSVTLRVRAPPPP